MDRLRVFLSQPAFFHQTLLLCAAFTVLALTYLWVEGLLGRASPLCLGAGLSVPTPAGRGTP